MTRDVVVRDHPEMSRYEAVVDGGGAFLAYERHPAAIVFVHTEVPESLRGQGIASQLAKTALEAARSAGVRVVARCPFVRAYLRKHPDAAETIESL